MWDGGGREEGGRENVKIFISFVTKSHLSPNSSLFFLCLTRTHTRIDTREKDTTTNERKCTPICMSLLDVDKTERKRWWWWWGRGENQKEPTQPTGRQSQRCWGLKQHESSQQGREISPSKKKKKKSGKKKKWGTHWTGTEGKRKDEGEWVRVKWALKKKSTL